MTETATEQLKELQSALRERVATINEGAEQGIKIDGANVEVKTEDAKAIRTAMKEAEDIRDAIEMVVYGPQTKAWLDEIEASINGNGNGNGSGSIALRSGGAVSGETVDGIPIGKSLGEAFLDSEEFKDFQGTKSWTMQKAFELEVADLTGYSAKAAPVGVTTSGVTATTTLGFGRLQRDAVVPRQTRQLRVRDLFPVVGTNANLIDFFRVSGFSDSNTESGSAGSVRERAAGADGTSAPLGNATDVYGLKPRSHLAFESASAAVRTLGHYEVAHRNVLSDEPQLRGTIDNELMYGLGIEEERQILFGSGANEQLLGIMNTPGIQSYNQASVAGDTMADALRRAATKAALAYFNPTGYVLHPNDWEQIELIKATGGGDGQYVLFTNVAVGAEQRVWRQPVVETPAMTENSFLTGAFGIAAQLYDRMQANVRIAEQHEDLFVRNAVVVLAEERLALATKRPAAFVKGTFVP